MSAALVLALSLATAPPLAEDPAYQHAIGLYEAVELEKAAQAFQGLSNDDRPAGEKSLVLAWLGLTLAQLGRNDDAKLAFVDAAKLNPDVELPAAAPPGVEEMFDAAKKEASAPPPPPDAPPPVEEPVADDPGDDAAPPVDAAPADGEGGPGLSWNLLAGSGVAVLGLGLVVTGGIITAIGLGTAEEAYAAEYNDDAVRLADTADTQIILGSVIAGTAVVVMGGGAALALIPLE
jgi:tetratricopeptide (TPR) repeat protein